MFGDTYITCVLLIITSDGKISYTLLDNSTNIWQYKCEVMFYDGRRMNLLSRLI